MNFYPYLWRRAKLYLLYQEPSWARRSELCRKGIGIRTVEEPAPLYSQSVESKSCVVGIKPRSDSDRK